jgi:hypothetical protein
MTHTTEPQSTLESRDAADGRHGQAIRRRPPDQTTIGWELIRCPGCQREHARRSTAVLVLSCPRCGRQPEAFALQLAQRLELHPLGRVGARVVGRDLISAGR